MAVGVCVLVRRSGRITGTRHKVIPLNLFPLASLMPAGIPELTLMNEEEMVDNREEDGDRK